MHRISLFSFSAYVVALVMLVAPVSAGATTYQYFLGTLFNLGQANTSDGYKLRDTNNVKRPCDRHYTLKYFYSAGGNYLVSNSSNCTFTLGEPYNATNIAACQNTSGQNHVNVSCWTIQ